MILPEELYSQISPEDRKNLAPYILVYEMYQLVSEKKIYWRELVEGDDNHIKWEYAETLKQTLHEKYKYNIDNDQFVALSKDAVYRMDADMQIPAVFSVTLARPPAAGELEKDHLLLTNT